MSRSTVEWLPSDSEEDSIASAITWEATPSPQHLVQAARAPSSLPASSPTSSIVPFDSGQRICSSDPGVDQTSPIVGNAEERKAIIRRKALRKRRATMELNDRALAEAREELARAEEEMHAEREDELRKLQQTRQQEQRDTCVRLLRIMRAAGVSLGTFLLFVLDPESQEEGLRERRWEELFRDRSIVDRILTFWTTHPKTPSLVRERVDDWITSRVARLASREGARVTHAGWMRCPNGGLSKQDILDFRLDEFYPKFETTTPVTLRVIESFCTSRRQRNACTRSMQMRKRNVLTQVMTSLLREHSRYNDLVAVYNGLYLYATGAQRQTISVLSHSGWSCSYPRLIDRIQPVDDGPTDVAITEAIGGNTTVLAPGAPRSKRRTGIIPGLASSCLADARRLAVTGRYKTAYDNVNFMDPVAEQIVGRKDAQQNMTNATAAPLHANNDEFDVVEALDLDAAEAAFLAAPELEITDLMFSKDEAELWEDLLIDTTLEIIIDHGRDGFERFRVQLDAARPIDAQQIRVHKTALYPLQTMDIDEALITGNIEVVNEIHVQLGVDMSSPEAARKVRLFFGDQLTIARQRSIIAARAGHERSAESWRWAKPVLALFHTDMAAVSCVFAAHYGRSDATAQDPGSLSFHNTVLDRKPIVLTSLPPYRVCRDLIYVSLYARVLHCLLLVSNQPDLASCSNSIVTWQELRSYGQEIYRTFASVEAISVLHRERDTGSGDVIFENGVLFLRDALGLRTFCRAVKSGRSGHIVLALKWLALMFKAGGHPKYAREMLFLLHHLTHVWPPKLKELVLCNWLVNPTGHKDGWVALDLMQEHMNFWIKKMYAAHGINASWEWLAMISPCVDILRTVANQMHSALGSYQGSTHTTPDLTRDIDELMKSLAQRKIYTKGSPRGDAGDEVEPVTDLLTVGFQQMLLGANTALSEYNDEFRTLQARCRVNPLQPYDPNVAPALGTVGRHPESGGEQRGEQSNGASLADHAALATNGQEYRSLEQTAQNERSQAVRSSTDITRDGGNESEASDTASSASSEFEDYSGYDELYLRLFDENDVDLDPDSVWQDAEASDNEQEADGVPEPVDSDGELPD